VLLPDEQNPKVRQALAAVENLARWLRSAPEEFAAWYAGEGEGDSPDIELRSFWDRHLW
jgi:hypothetical protein